jgi:uncharacterized iron-regulated membrane protein
MKLQVFSRKAHYWASITVALPVLVIVGSGVLLQLKKQLAWVQPPEQRGSGEPVLSLPEVLAISSRAPEAGIRSWADVHRVDVRPSRGMLKVSTHAGWEVQIDTGTGEILQVARRRSDLIEQIHDGSFFHEHAKLWLFLPAGLTLLGLWLTGIYLFVLPFAARRRKAARLAVEARTR